MGINIILPLIIGMALMVSLGSQVVPSFVEQMKVTKVENRTISNQNLIKDAIVRYIKMEKKVPKTLEELKTSGLLMDYHESNIFGGGYSFTIDKKKGTLTIFTTINDDVAGKYFSNSFKFPNKPNCVELVGDSCKNGEWETFYLLDEDTFKSILPPEVGSKEDILDRFTADNIGNKKDKDGKDIVFGVGDKDNFLQDNKNGTFTIIEKEKQPNGTWLKTDKETTISGNNIGKETGVFISNLEIPYHEWNETEKKLVPAKYQHEKVHCKDVGEDLLEKEVFVINKNTGLGELVWVAPNNASELQKKIFGDNDQSTRQSANNIIGEGIKYAPNNICTSNLKTFYTTINDGMFYLAKEFNQPLDRWDTSNVTNMYGMLASFRATSFNQKLNFDTSSVTNMSYMFYNAEQFNKPLKFDTSNVTDMSRMFSGSEASTSEFNQDISNWNTSNVTNMMYMFSEAYEFNQPIGNWNTSKVTNMEGMFNWAEKFNQDISQWDVSNVTNMSYMFSGASVFNQPIGDWNTSNVTTMEQMFLSATSFNQDLSGWCVSKITAKPIYFDSNTNWIQPKPTWGTCPNP